MATRLLNKGKLFTIDNSVIESKSASCSVNGNTFSFGSAGEIKLNKKVDHTFVKYHVKMNDAHEVKYRLYGNSTIYPDVCIQRRVDGTYLEVNHTNSFVSLNVYLGQASLDEFDVKLIIDGNRVEFAVNDTIVLTAITMNTGDYSPAFIADGGATISNISINRLAQCYDIYD